MDFWKMNGAGNDFIILDDREEAIPDEKLTHIAATLCHRRMSIGADGLMVVRPAKENGDYRMLFFNSDGSEAGMCGNGSRCICRYGYENGLAGTTQRVETLSGTVEGTRIDERRYRVRLNSPSVLEPDHPVEIDGKTYPCAYVELGMPGLPHAAVSYDGLLSADKDVLRAFGRKLRYHPSFPQGANVTFYEIMGENKLRAVTYERGVEDFTLACGTGVASAVTAIKASGKLGDGPVTVEMPGGTLTIEVGNMPGVPPTIYLTGPTNIVCKGTVTDEDLEV